jgi:hypothetical protein
MVKILLPLLGYGENLNYPLSLLGYGEKVKLLVPSPWLDYGENPKISPTTVTIWVEPKLPSAAVKL